MADPINAPVVVLAQNAPPLDPPRRRILVLKLDHHGDFIIGLPALERLRSSFPNDHITLVCGSWNEGIARATRLADEIVIFNLYPENVQGWDRRPVEDRTRFREMIGSAYDIAIDLRVDEDTRGLLTEVDARTRCGIGSRRHFPFLDIILPGENWLRSETLNDEISRWVFLPGDFHTRAQIKTTFMIETDFSIANKHLTWGPYVKFPTGRFRVVFGVQPVGIGNQKLRAPLAFDIGAHNPATDSSKVLASTILGNERRAELLSGQIALDFENCDEGDRIEFRIYLGNRPFEGSLRFLGVTVIRLEDGDWTAPPRFVPAEMHIGESLDLLVQLVADRLRPVQPSSMRRLLEAEIPDAVVELMQHAGPGAPIFIAPFSNSTLRDWPLDHYVTLIGYLLVCFDCPIGLLGARSHGAAIDQIVRRFGGSARLIPFAGTIAWSTLPALLRQAKLVISNNSGIVHLAAATGAPTLAIYSGSHEPQKWGPRGPRTRVLTASVPCAPCGLDRLEDCTYEHRCMKLVTPEVVRDHAIDLLRTPGKP